MTIQDRQDITAQLDRIEERLNEILAAIRASKPQTWPDDTITCGACGHLTPRNSQRCVHCGM